MYYYYSFKNYTVVRKVISLIGFSYLGNIKGSSIGSGIK